MVDHLVFYAIDRLSRQRHDYSIIHALLAGLGVRFDCVTQPIDDTPTGKLMEGIYSVIAQFDNDMRAERTRVGMRAAAQSGRWKHKPPLGYLNGPPGGSSSILDPDRAPLIRQAFELYSTRRYAKSEVLRQVTSLGLRTRQGRKVSSQPLNSLLKNPIYIGRIVKPKRGGPH
ncbi:MAG: recombinase family protein [Myxococcales bacterium]|nr:recombinase family protein [Myxococcales bacterium]